MRFLQRILTPDEIAFCTARHNPAPCIAGRFASKEAAFKALGTGWGQGVGWQDVEVVRPPGQAPALRLSGQALMHAQEVGVRSIHLSLSHSEDSAVAMVVLEK